MKLPVSLMYVCLITLLLALEDYFLTSLSRFQTKLSVWYRNLIVFNILFDKHTHKVYVFILNHGRALICL